MIEFEDVEARIAGIEGWLRPEQARRLWELAAALPAGSSVVEIGSYQGKSTVVLGSAAAPGVTVHAIDPHAGNDRGPGEWHGDAADGQADHVAFRGNLAEAGVEDRIVHVREFSQDAHDAVVGPVHLLYVDGAHGYAPARSDLVGWGGRVVIGGTMAIHDVYTSVFVTLAVVRTLWFSRSWRYVGRIRSMSVYERVAPGEVRVLPNALAQVANVPWFAKNLVVKALAAVGLHRLARLGHGPGGGLY